MECQQDATDGVSVSGKNRERTVSSWPTEPNRVIRGYEAGADPGDH